MFCCDPILTTEEKKNPNGKCPDCGDDTVDGQSVYDCGYSPCICKTCNSKPCDGSC